MTVLDRCIIFAADKHSGQVYAGCGGFEAEPYIFHPLRVMLRMATEEERQVAVLHDVLEDTATTPAEPGLYRPHRSQLTLLSGHFATPASLTSLSL